MSSAGRTLVAWSRGRARALPWRGANPYRIWISEVMLQQTRVETVIPYYRRFLAEFPTLRKLADAELQSVLRAWEGLGYYSRARNLHRAARTIQKESGGRLPRTAAEWERLPGVGRYTAAAIASLAHGDPAAALDANARRILARLHAYRRPVRGARADRELADLYEKARGPAPPGAFFQALMDLGQQVCLPLAPLCPECPLRRGCRARRLGIQSRLPRKTARARVPHVDVTAGVIGRAGRVLLARRPEDKLLGGLWEFPGGKVEPGEDLPACLRRELKEELGVGVRVRGKILAVRHAFTHFRITLHVFRCDLRRGIPRPIGAAAVRWVPVRRLGLYPMGKADRKVAAFLAEVADPA